MKRSTAYLLSTALFVTSGLFYHIGSKQIKKLEKPVASEKIQTYNFLTSTLEKTKEPASNEFKKAYIQNMQALQESNPHIGQQTKQFNKEKIKYTKNKNVARGLQLGGLLGIVGSYVLCCAAATAYEPTSSQQNE
ncbi:MAG: hypothetical protein ACOCQQ_00380 [Candidatus Nanoarchaeia archaeon]